MEPRSNFQNRITPQYAMHDPYFEDALKMHLGDSILIETVRGNLQGILADVEPGYIVLESYDNDTLFYVRVQQIVHVMPD